MRLIALFAALCSICSIVRETQSGGPLDNACQTLCLMQKIGQGTNINLTRALKGCCDEATTSVLPAHFYKLPCEKELMDVCLHFEKRSASNLTWQTELSCCENFNSNETERGFKGSRRRFKNISVDWNNETFLPDRDQSQKPLFRWKRKQWVFFLKMSTQTCLNSTERIFLTSSSVTVKFKYPIFAKRESYEKKFVHGFYAPVSYLVMKKEDHDMLTILGESVKHLWVILCICITWTLISGVIIWLLVSLVIRYIYVCSTSLVCIFYIMLVNVKYTILFPVEFCLLENVEQFIREVCEFCRNVVLPGGKNQP